MAQQFPASIYRYGKTDATAPFSTPGNSIPALKGIIEGFPSQGIRISPVHGTVTACGKTMAAIIEVLPSGLNQQSKYYYTSTSVADLITAANA